MNAQQLRDLEKNLWDTADALRTNSSFFNDIKGLWIHLIVNYILNAVWYSITPQWLRFHNQIIKVNFPYVIDLKQKWPPSQG